jgi:hypothetical protein
MWNKLIKKKREKRAYIRVLNCLADLQQEIFVCLLSHNYAKDTDEHEKNLHRLRTAVIHAMLAARRFGAKNKIMQTVEEIYESLQAMGLMIYRVKDHNTFSVAEKEFGRIATDLVKCFARSIALLRNPQKITPIPADLNEAIFELAELNRSMLSVVADNPLAFSIFIRDVSVLENSFLQLTDAIQELR